MICVLAVSYPHLSVIGAWLSHTIRVKADQSWSLLWPPCAARPLCCRRAYQRAVGVPSVQLESLWRDYEGWENKVDKQLARKVCGAVMGVIRVCDLF